MITRHRILSAAVVLAVLPFGAGAADPELVVSGLQGAGGSTVGPGGALYVTEGAVGRVSRVDPETGVVTTFAEGLPPALPGIGIGGAMDVAFIGSTAYVLVTLVGSDVEGDDIVGIYRVDGPNSFTVIADLGSFALANPPDLGVFDPTGSEPPAGFFNYFIPTGVQYALETWRGGLLVTDGHLNRVLWISLDGVISELIAFNNVVPTGLAVNGGRVYMARSGPTPHTANDGKVLTFGPSSFTPSEVASGAPLAVDVEFGRGRMLYALSQGAWNGAFPGSPASPDTGALLEVNDDGTMTVVAELSIPTSVEFIGNDAYVVNLLGEIWRIEDVSEPPFGRARERK